MAGNREMAEFAENLWDNYLKEKAIDLLKNQIFGFRAVVTARPGGGKLTVQRPFDYDSDGNPVSLTLPCAGSMTGVSVGTQVLCLGLGTMSNAFILSKADLSNL